jgi:hypothetical protein
MPDYQNGKIYKLVSNNDPDLVYYGSTTQPLSVRKAGHMRNYRYWKQGISKYRPTTTDVIESGDVDIVLVENYPCDNKEKLHKRERHWIDCSQCVNKHIPSRTYEEWREANKDKIRERAKEYYAENINVIKEKRKRAYRAKCDGKNV